MYLVKCFLRYVFHVHLILLVVPFLSHALFALDVFSLLPQKPPQVPRFSVLLPYRYLHSLTIRRRLAMVECLMIAPRRFTLRTSLAPDSHFLAMTAMMSPPLPGIDQLIDSYYFSVPRPSDPMASFSYS
jgi:hypothetical protein